ncbi:hypothetical protein P3X46_011434 [Hevea brasiliensis]|uniref:ADP-ribosyl cyclase/cyclic ADP-ribose hydrolase n=1 Tax=Hevea brasiliensis TaxID=3981 RepID=A0ABQ9M746_HEVBR|nr:hypothetical protein P3X46_011434 [Hevea brasiliensis]
MASAASSFCKYDVFLSFRGEDTRKNFTSHLFAGLRQKRIITFKDDQELKRGKTISQELLRAIQDSKISIVVFSTSYASSSWCLDELVQIFKCMKNQGQTVLPVFYHVNPTDVRKQTGSYGISFAHHEHCFNNLQKVQQWRIAMTELANLSGWDLQDSAAKNLDGMSSLLTDMSMYLDMKQTDDVHFIGICGMGGIGKTTIARVVYEELSSQFEGSSFLANVREVHEKHDLVPLQIQLLSEILNRNITIWDANSGTNEIRNRLHLKKVLKVLDDVDQLEQLRLPAGMHDWFGKGSRIIITSRDEHLLICHGIDKIYRAEEGLSDDEALHLFCLKAFKSGYLADDYVELCNHFVNYCTGLPLALDVLGSFLVGKSVNEWRSALGSVMESQSLYYFSVYSKIFRDIACFFNGEDKDLVMKVLGSCGFYPDIGINVLINKSLITISKERIWMHDLLQEIGREIVHQESPKEPGKRSRLLPFRVSSILIFYILQDAPNLGKLNLEGCTRLLDVHQSIGDLERLVLLNLKDCKSLARLPNSICDLKSLKFLNLHGCSKLEKLPEGWGDMTSLEKLYAGGIGTRQLALNKFWGLFLHSRFLPWKTPNSNSNPNPMVMMLPSLLVLRSLRSLDLSYYSLVEGALPSDMSCFPSLRTLNLSGNDFRLQSFPNLPSSILYLSMDGCTALESLLPRSISKQFELENLCTAVDCKRLQLLPGLSSSILYPSVDGSTPKETIPNPFGTDITRPSSLTLVNCVKLFEVQSKNITKFARLISYLHYLLRHSSQGLFSPSSHVSMCLAGSEIRGWFNSQSPGSSLELHLPPYWWATKWMGFAFCMEFGFHMPFSDSSPISCDLHACISSDQDLFLGSSTIQISKDMSVTSDQLLFNYMPRSSLIRLDLWKACNQLKVTFFSNQLRVKYRGFRAIYSRDLDELISCRNSFQNLGFPCTDNFDNSKRSREDYCCGSGEEANENGNLTNGLPSKRLRMPVDPDS